MHLTELRDQVGSWSRHCFGNPAVDGHIALLGVAEEVGELCHYHAKLEKGYRTEEDHEAEIEDAIGDIVIYLADYCSARNIDFETAVAEAWEKVRSRDWNRFSKDGKTE